MAFDTITDFGGAMGAVGSGLQDLNLAIFGTPGGNTVGQSETTGEAIGKGTSTQNRTTRQFGTSFESLKISDEAIAGIIEDIMSEADGLAEIFAGDRRTGLYNSSVAAEEAGDLAAKILAEVGKLRATKVSKDRGTQIARANARQRQEQRSHSGTKAYQDTDGGGGILDNLGIG